MRTILATAVLALSLAGSAVAAPNPWLKSISEAQKSAQKKKSYILVDMYAEWCGWCHRFEREVFPSKVFQDATDDIVLLRLDTEDGGEGTAFARKFGVTSLPTFLLLNPDLSLAGQIRGYSPPSQFAQTLAETRKNHADFLGRLKNESAIARDHAKRLELAKELAERQSYGAAEPRLKKLTTEKGVPVAVRDEAYYVLAAVYAIQEKETQGLAVIRQLLSASKSGKAVENGRFLAGQIYLKQGNLKAAANEFRTLKATFPNSPLVRNVDAMLPGIERQIQSGK